MYVGNVAGSSGEKIFGEILNIRAEASKPSGPSPYGFMGSSRLRASHLPPPPTLDLRFDHSKIRILNTQFKMSRPGHASVTALSRPDRAKPLGKIRVVTTSRLQHPPRGVPPLCRTLNRPLCRFVRLLRSNQVQSRQGPSRLVQPNQGKMLLRKSGHAFVKCIILKLICKISPVPALVTQSSQRLYDTTLQCRTD